MTPSPPAVRHVVWDWNGTLYDDFPLILASCNAALAEVGGPVVDHEMYRARFTRPVRAFYAELLGRDIDDTLWGRIDRLFHDHYHSVMGDAGLRGEAPAVLDAVAAAGLTQSVLSMWHHDRLVPFAEHLGIADRFVRIDGLHGEVGGGSKAPHLATHLRALRDHGVDPDPAEVVMIGDTLDDAAACDANGVRAVLYAGGEHGPASLARAGHPIAHDLGEAIGYLGVTTGA